MDGTRTRHELTLEIIQTDKISYEVASTRLDEILTTFAQAELWRIKAPAEQNGAERGSCRPRPLSNLA